MIGPIAPGATFPVLVKYLTTPTLPGIKVISVNDGSLLIAHQTLSVRDAPNLIYGKVLTAPSSAADGWYATIVDDNGAGGKPDDYVWVTGAIAALPTVAGPGAVGPYTVANPFKMKRGDTVPIFGPVDLTEADGSPYTIPVGSTVHIAARKLPGSTFQIPSPPNDFQAGTLVYHKPVPAWDGTSGWQGTQVSYEFPAGDVDWVGYTLFEIQVDQADGGRWSFPGAQANPEYIPAIVYADEDEGT